MKRIITAILAASLVLCGAVSCAKRTKVNSSIDGTAVTTTDTELSGTADDSGTVSDVPTESFGVASDIPVFNSSGETSVAVSEPEEYSLEVYNGWWKHIGANVAGEPMVEAFCVDAESGTWTEYSASGIKGGTYECYADERGLNMKYGDVGITTLKYDGITLLNYAGFIEYVPSDPIEEIEPSAYDGKWYELGDTDGVYYEIAGDTCVYHGDSEVKGTWTSETVMTVLDSGTEVEEIILTLVCGDDTKKLIVADKGGALYDAENNNAYISEDDLGTIRGDDLVKKYDLICHEWAGESEDMATVIFGYYENKFYLVNTFTLGDEPQIIKEVAGTWSIHEYELSLHYADGHEERTPYDPEMLTFSYYNHMVVTKSEK